MLGSVIDEIRYRFLKTRYRNKVWFHLRSGKKFYPFKCSPDDIEIRDIANSLSKICRYGSHTYGFYSVAEHSYYVSMLCDPKDALWGLLHDAGEAYLGDLIYPVKQLFPMFDFLERDIMKAITSKFGLDKQMPDSVWSVDRGIWIPEARELQLIDPEEHGWPDLSDERLSLNIQKLQPQEAELLFLNRYKELTTHV